MTPRLKSMLRLSLTRSSWDLLRGKTIAEIAKAQRRTKGRRLKKWAEIGHVGTKTALGPSHEVRIGQNCQACQDRSSTNVAHKVLVPLQNSKNIDLIFCKLDKLKKM